MKVARENLHKLGDDDQLLWILLAQTGMRLSEPFAIEEEFRQDGVRFASQDGSHRPALRATCRCA
jgi:hypothetical protein